jgi:hypothetical protein
MIKPPSTPSRLAENTTCDISSIVASCTTSSLGPPAAAQKWDINTHCRKRSPTVAQPLGCLVPSYNIRYCCLTSQQITETTCHVILTHHTAVWRHLRMCCIALRHMCGHEVIAVSTVTSSCWGTTWLLPRQSMVQLELSSNALSKSLTLPPPYGCSSHIA